jgi:tRNA threonylcarbamoyl adenosine modification protein YjeE
MTSTPDSPGRLDVRIADEAALAGVAADLVAALPREAFVTLEGDLGAGKTTFVKAIAAAAGIDPAEVVSPTFGLIHLHAAAAPAGGLPLRLVHADMYRLADESELHELGWEDAILPREGSRTWAFVEWPGRIARALPEERLDIAIGIDSETARTLSFTSRSAAYDTVIAALSSRATRVPPQSRP